MLFKQRAYQMKRNQVLSAEEAVDAVKELLSKENIQRLSDIESLDLTQVEHYIAVIREMQKYFKYISNRGITSMRADLSKYYNSITGKITADPILPEPLMDKLKNLAIELLQRKAILETIERNQSSIFRARIMRGGLSSNEQRSFESSEIKKESDTDLEIDCIKTLAFELPMQIKEAEEDLIYDTLEAHNNLLGKFKELKNNNAKIEAEAKESQRILEQTLAHDKSLQQDMEAIRCQLLESQNSSRESAEQLATITLSHQQLQVQFRSLQSSALKENEQLKQQIQHLGTGLRLIGTIPNPPLESKTVVPEVAFGTISKKQVIKLIKINNCKTGPGLFDCSSSPEDSILCLQSLLKTKKLLLLIPKSKSVLKRRPLSVFLRIL